jgi:hypothetical protein
VDYPTRTSLGADYKISETVALFAAQEFTWGETADTNGTRAGVRATPWMGGSVTSSVERQMGENDSRIFANLGLRQTWQLTDAWKIDAGVDRSQTIKRSGYYTINANVPPASGASQDFTALSTGATYQIKHFLWDSRFEYRTSDSEDKWGVLSGLVSEEANGWAWSARGQYFRTDSSTGAGTRTGSLRFGLVYRPATTRWIHLDRFDVNYDDAVGTGSSTTSVRYVNNYNLNFMPRKDLQVSLKYGAKFVMDTIAGERYNSFTDHVGTEVRHDITKKWDVGLRGSVLHSWHGGQFSYSGGTSAGYNVADNMWVSVGYNVTGFSDKDFSAADYTAQGPYLRFRMKFDQNSLKDVASWASKQ